MNKQVDIQDTPYNKKQMSLDTSILLGRSQQRDDYGMDEMRLSEARPKKKLVVNDGNTKELLSEQKYTIVRDDNHHHPGVYLNTRYGSHNKRI